MNDGVSIALIAASLVVAAWGVLTCALDRMAGTTHLVGGAVVELAALAQLVVGIAALAGGDDPASSKVTFVAYLVGCLLLPPVAAFLALLERSRWGSAIVAVAGLVLPVMVVRLQQVWEGTSG